MLTCGLSSAFSFSDQRFATPWITVSDGTGKFLDSLEFKFVYRGNDIVSFSWNAICAGFHLVFPNDLSLIIFTDRGLNLGTGIKEVFIEYRWHQMADSDPQGGLTLLFIGSTVGVAYSSWLVLRDWGKMSLKFKR